jgi:hypothetical protein
MKGRTIIGVGGIGVALSLAGCDQLLGIHDTIDQDWDGGSGLPSGSNAATSMSSSMSANQDGSMYVNPVSSGDGSVPPPIDAGNVSHWADWKMPNPPNTMLPNPQVYDTTTTVGIAQDTVTKLQWQTATDGVVRTWNAAVAYCASLSESDGGWRLPSRIELFSILDYTTAPAISTASFGALPVLDSGTYVFWTSSLKAGDNSQAWAVDFGSSVDLVFPKALTTTYLVRCVRGGS